MDLIMVIAAFPIGWLVRNRLAAYVVYLAGFNFLFTFQAMDEVIDWAGGSKQAFGPFPKAHSANVLGYGLVNLLLLVAGIGLLVAGRYVDGRRQARRADPTFGQQVAA